MGGGLTKYAPDALMTKAEVSSELGDEFTDLQWEALSGKDAEGRVPCSRVKLVVEKTLEQQNLEKPWLDPAMPAQLGGLRAAIDSHAGPAYMFDRDEFARELEALEGAYGEYDTDQNYEIEGASAGAAGAGSYFDGANDALDHARLEAMSPEERQVYEKEQRIEAIRVETEKLERAMAAAEEMGVPKDQLADLYGAGDDFDVAEVAAAVEQAMEIVGAEMVFQKLHDVVSREVLNKTRGFGNEAFVNYYKMFHHLDLDLDQSLQCGEFVECVRNSLKLDDDDIESGDLERLFFCLDLDDSGEVSLREFSAFARGAQPILQLPEPSLDCGPGAGDDVVDDGILTLTPEGVNELIHENYARKTLHVGKDNVPDRLNKVHLVMWYLAQLVGESTLVAKEKRRKYFNPAKLNYYQCFNALDIDGSGAITKIEWVDILRTQLEISDETISTADLKLLFDIIDADNSGDITVKEFSAFLRGASSSVQARGMAEIVKSKKAAGKIRRSLNLGTKGPKGGPRGPKAAKSPKGGMTSPKGKKAHLSPKGGKMTPRTKAKK